MISTIQRYRDRLDLHEGLFRGDSQLQKRIVFVANQHRSYLLPHDGGRFRGEHVARCQYQRGDEDVFDGERWFRM